MGDDSDCQEFSGFLPSFVGSMLGGKALMSLHAGTAPGLATFPRTFRRLDWVDFA